MDVTDVFFLEGTVILALQATEVPAVAFGGLRCTIVVDRVPLETIVLGGVVHIRGRKKDSLDVWTKSALTLTRATVADQNVQLTWGHQP